MKPDENNPNGYKVVYFNRQSRSYITCYNSFQYHKAKLYKDKTVAREQRWKNKNNYIILPMRKKDKRIWKKVPF